MSIIDNFERLLARGTDNALLRFGLGNACLQAGRVEDAVVHLARAVAHDPAYSAAWKLYGKALCAAGRLDEAAAAYSSGIDAAQRKGDVQAAKEMRVFLRRVQRRRAQ